MLQAKLQQKARDQERVAAHSKRKITFVFIPLSGIGEEQVETLKDLEDDLIIARLSLVIHIYVFNNL